MNYLNIFKDDANKNGMSEEITPGFYRHYKDKYYQVLGVGRHSETLELVVTYRALYPSAEFGDYALWVRPLEMFSEMVEWEGQTVQRFSLVTDENKIRELEVLVASISK